MQPIDQSLQAFTEHLENNLPIQCRKSSPNWKPEGPLGRFFRLILCKNNQHLLDIGKSFCKALNALEQTPITFSADKSITEHQVKTHHQYLKAANAVQKLLRTSSSSRVKTRLEILAQKVTALQYRLEVINGGLDRSESDPELTKQVVISALTWKKKHPLYTDRALTNKDLAKLADTCQYPIFAKLLIHDKRLQEQFFSWTLRDNNGVGQFVEFPSTCKRLTTAKVAGRIGRFGPDTLQLTKIVKSEGNEKVMLLPFFSGKKVEHINILDESREVVLAGDYRLTIKKIFDTFFDKEYRPGDIEFFGSTGITNWNCHELGSWNPKTNSYDQVDITSPDWVKNLPPIEVMSKEEIENRYGVKLDKDDWLVSPRSSRESPDQALEGRHSFLELVIPSENGKYSIYSFGKYSKEFPSTTPALLAFLLATVVGKIAYPDENMYRSDRQHAVLPIKLRPEVGQQVLQHIQRDLIKSRDGNLIFQFRRENCSYWVQSVLDNVESINAPILFQATMLDSTAVNPVLAKIFDWMRKAPKSWQPTIVNAIDFILGGWRGITIIENGKQVFRSISLTADHEKPHIFQPGCLHKKIEDGHVNGLIFLGH